MVVSASKAQGPPSLQAELSKLTGTFWNMTYDCTKEPKGQNGTEWDMLGVFAQNGILHDEKRTE